VKVTTHFQLCFHSPIRLLSWWFIKLTDYLTLMTSRIAVTEYCLLWCDTVQCDINLSKIWRNPFPPSSAVKVEALGSAEGEGEVFRVQANNIWREWRYNSTLNASIEWPDSGPRCLILGKGAPTHCIWEWVGSKRRSGHFEGQKSLFSLPGIEQNLDRPFHRKSLRVGARRSLDGRW
jgi:hypothetical protein